MINLLKFVEMANFGPFWPAKTGPVGPEGQSLACDLYLPYYNRMQNFKCLGGLVLELDGGVTPPPLHEGNIGENTGEGDRV